MTYHFKLTDPNLVAIIRHTLTHKDECSVAYSGGEEKAEPSVYLVKDRGAYIMCCTKTQLPGTGKPNMVSYADGCGPDDDWIGGDDFAENIPLEWFTDAMKKKHKNAFITLAGDKMKFNSN